MNLQKQTIHHNLKSKLESKNIHFKQTPKKLNLSLSFNQPTKSKNFQLLCQKQKSNYKRKNNSIYDLNRIPSQSNTNLYNNLHYKIQDFRILTRCIKAYCQEQLKEGQNPWKNIVKLIQAFNKSQLKQECPKIQQLVQQIIKTLNYAHLKMEKSNNSNKKLKQYKSQKSNKKKTKGRIHRNNLLFDKKSLEQMNKYQASQFFSSVNKSKSKSFNNNLKQTSIEKQRFREKIMSQIVKLQRNIFQASKKHQKLKQAQIFTTKLTKYEKCLQINKLRQIIKQQDNQISLFRQKIQQKKK